MIFSVSQRSKRSRARLGHLRTAHGTIDTPALIPVATQATVKTLTPAQVLATKTQALICNTFHLHVKPGERVVRAAGGLHEFMQWPRPLFTDSAGYQVFSLGFGRDLGVGKIAARRGRPTLTAKAQPSSLRIREHGVEFRSPVDGRKLFIGPRESMRIQRALGADIIFAFDECTAPTAGKAYTAASLQRTHRWAAECLAAPHRGQALFGIVQGGQYKDLRIESARVIGSMPFDGFGIGGEFGSRKQTMVSMIGWVTANLPDDKPRHLLGIGHPEDIVPIIRAGVDTFDCIAPTHYARHGTAFTSRGRLDITKSLYRDDRRSLDPNCACGVCRDFTRSYLAHLFRAKEILGMVLLTQHNLWYLNVLVAACRREIRAGRL